MIFLATKQPVFNRGVAPDAFLEEMVRWASKAPDALFEVNAAKDIYSYVKPELGPYESLLCRKAVMLEVMRVLAGFESEWNWKMGIDSSRRTATTNENAEAGAWQASWDARKLDISLSDLLAASKIKDGSTFQRRMKEDHELAMTFIATQLRIDMKNFERIANGPIRKGSDRRRTWPDRPALWKAEQSIYPWVKGSCVKEFMDVLRTL